MFNFLPCMLEFYYFLLNIHSLIHTNFFPVFWGKCKCWDGVLFMFLGNNNQLNNCFGKFRGTLIRAYWCDLMQARLLIWADSACWTG